MIWLPSTFIIPCSVFDILITLKPLRLMTSALMHHPKDTSRIIITEKPIIVAIVTKSMFA
jgi:hypothetical protein